ncbi:MAG: hypothetical protein WC631_01525 [Candidatus Paceibacterota bacterium]|jgi:hypothetical protein
MKSESDKQELYKKHRSLIVKNRKMIIHDLELAMCRVLEKHKKRISQQKKSSLLPAKMLVIVLCEAHARADGDVKWQNLKVCDHM